MSTVIFGGSFDPVHNGHIDIIRQLAARFDRVIVIPTYISPFKLQGGAADGSHRLKMLRMAIGNIRGIELSEYELRQGGCSYTIDTVRALDLNDDVWLAIGSEGVSTLHLWKEMDELRTLVGFYVIERPQFVVGLDMVEQRRKQGYRIKVADFVGLDISSSQIRVANAFDRISGLVPNDVASYIKINSLYDNYNKYTSAYSVFGMKQSRIDHTFGAVMAGIKLAKRFSADVDKTIVALILHDIGKYMDLPKLAAMHIPIQKERLEGLPEPCHHAVFSQAIARHYFGITDEELLEAILTHTTCEAGMSLVGQIVALADFIEDGRDFEGLSEIRKAAESDLTLAVVLMLKHTIAYFEAENKYLHPSTYRAYKYYSQLKRS